MRISVMVWLALMAAAVFQAAYFIPQMPDPVASHFDGSGQADGFMSRSGFAAFHVILMASMGLLFPGIAWTIKFFPTGMINLPHRDYWLAPERREASLRFVADTMIWFGSATMVFLIWLMQMTINSNISGTNQLPMGPFWLALVGYLAFTAIWILALYRRFPRPAQP